MERLENCQMTTGNTSCNGCEVAVEVAKNVAANLNLSQVESILEITDNRCPAGTKFNHVGDLRSLLDGELKVIPLREINGQSLADRAVPQIETAPVQAG